MARRVTGYSAHAGFSHGIRPQSHCGGPIALDSRIARCRHRQGDPEAPDSPGEHPFGRKAREYRLQGAVICRISPGPVEGQSNARTGPAWGIL